MAVQREIIYIMKLLLFTQVTYQTGIMVSGPGLQPQKIVMPARYFFINFTTINETLYTRNLFNDLAIEINGTTARQENCRIWVNKLDRRDGTFIVRYKVYETCHQMDINIYYQSKHIEGSPFKYIGPIQPEQCDCPEKDIEVWLQQYGCPTSYDQITKDLKMFNNVDMKKMVKKIIDRYHKPESTSFCHYVLKNNELYRDCYGKHVGFNMFADNILLSLTRKVVFPDLELVINLGDWPLVRENTEPLPVFSWCGSTETIDIVIPTYDITESTLENMGRVTLDILSVQGSVERAWAEREPRAFWRGRDSRVERLKLIDIARNYPDLLNASLTNFFFFRDQESKYGPKQPHISFFKFFDYKYQINVDGTVAAYRLPYLLAGGGMVLKQSSNYYEHFYRQLQAWEHYVPIARNLSDITKRIEWARNNDEHAHMIARNARKFANEHLLPQNILCYHAVLLFEWSKRINSNIEVYENMTHVPQLSYTCDCWNRKAKHDEF